MSGSSDDVPNSAPAAAASAPRPGSAGVPTGMAVSADAVEAYLRRHPEFLNERPELIAALVPPDFDRGQGVVDMQRFMLQRMRSEFAQMSARERTLLAAAEANAAVQARVHAAVRSLLVARSFQHLIRIVVDEFPGMLDVAASTIAVENADRLPGAAGDTGVVVLKPGTIDALIGGERPMSLRPESEGDRVVFGAKAPRIRSVAMMRLTFGGTDTPPGLFALGSAAPEGFDARQGTDLLAFLAHVLQLRIRRWLALPP